LTQYALKHIATLNTGLIFNVFFSIYQKYLKSISFNFLM